MFRFKDQINFVSTGTFVVIELICLDHAEFSAFFELRYNKIFKELSAAGTGIKGMDNTVVGKIRFCGFDIAFCRAELVSVKSESQLSLMQGI